MKMERLKELRQERGLSQTELAKSNETRRSRNITRWEKRNKRPDKHATNKTCGLFGCSTDFC